MSKKWWIDVMEVMGGGSDPPRLKTSKGMGYVVLYGMRGIEGENQNIESLGFET